MRGVMAGPRRWLVRVGGGEKEVGLGHGRLGPSAPRVGRPARASNGGGGRSGRIGAARAADVRPPARTHLLCPHHKERRDPDASSALRAQRGRSAVQPTPAGRKIREAPVSSDSTNPMISNFRMVARNRSIDDCGACRGGYLSLLRNEARPAPSPPPAAPSRARPCRRRCAPRSSASEASYPWASGRGEARFLSASVVTLLLGRPKAVVRFAAAAESGERREQRQWRDAASGLIAGDDTEYDGGTRRLKGQPPGDDGPADGARWREEGNEGLAPDKPPLRPPGLGYSPSYATRRGRARRRRTRIAPRRLPTRRWRRRRNDGRPPPGAAGPAFRLGDLSQPFFSPHLFFQAPQPRAVRRRARPSQPPSHPPPLPPRPASSRRAARAAAPPAAASICPRSKARPARRRFAPLPSPRAPPTTVAPSVPAARRTTEAGPPALALTGSPLASPAPSTSRPATSPPLP